MNKIIKLASSLLTICSVALADAEQPQVVFASIGFGAAVSDYGFMSIESARMVYPSMHTFILNVMKHDPTEMYTRNLTQDTVKKMTFLPSVTKKNLYPMDSKGDQQTVMDISHAHMVSILETLRYCLQKYPDADLIFHDLDIIHMQPTLLSAFDRKPFTIGTFTRAPTKDGALNCGLLLFHHSKLKEAAAFFELVLHVYHYADYNLKRRSSTFLHEHSCCGQHAIQHALELVMGDKGHWERKTSTFVFHRRKISAVPSCVANLTDISDSFTLLSTPVRLLAPSASPDTSFGEKPTSSSGALHYKGIWKRYMLQDFKKLQSYLSMGMSSRETALKVFEWYKKGMTCITPCCLEDKGCPKDKRKFISHTISTCTKQPYFGRPSPKGFVENTKRKWSELTGLNLPPYSGSNRN